MKVMFKIGDRVVIKDEYLESKETKGLVFKVVDVNEITKRCYIEIADSDLPLNPQELVGFDMIELA